MSVPATPMKISVVIPAFNQAEFVGDAIRSVLNQTYSALEVFVVNDASTDRTTEVLAGFDDPRLRVITHERNRGLSAARNSGIRVSSGDLVAFLDADDLFHKDKIAAHVDFFQAHPEVGVTYNARYELNHSRSTVRELWRPPATCQLGDLVAGFPFAPSDMVVRRDWFPRIGLFDETLVYFSEDLDINCRLALAGCRFACVDGVLNYRRYHAARALQVRERLEAALGVISGVFGDPRCPAEVFALQDVAQAAHYLVWAFYSFLQDDTACGREFLRCATRLDCSYLEHGPERLLRFLLRQCVTDESCDHKAVLRRILDQFPPELRYVDHNWEAAAAQGYLLRAVTAAMWGRPDEAKDLFGKARASKAHTDRSLVGLLATHLLNIEELLGPEAAAAALGRVTKLAQPSFTSTVRELKACYFLNKGFRSYRRSNYCDVIKSAGKAIISDSRCAANRGLLSIAARSAWRMLPLPNRGPHAFVE